MWREWSQWLERQIRAQETHRELPPLETLEDLKFHHVAPENEPWPFGHHVPPDILAKVERHRGEWRT